MDAVRRDVAALGATSALQHLRATNARAREATAVRRRAHGEHLVPAIRHGDLATTTRARHARIERVQRRLRDDRVPEQRQIALRNSHEIERPRR